MSAVQEKLKSRRTDNVEAAETPDPTIYRALRSGRYWLDGQPEFPNLLGEFVAEGSTQRVADLESYHARGFLVVADTQDFSEPSEE